MNQHDADKFDALLKYLLNQMVQNPVKLKQLKANILEHVAGYGFRGGKVKIAAHLTS